MTDSASVYRYMPLGGDERLLWRLRSVLEESKLYFSPPRDLNDPSEGGVSPAPEPSVENLIECLRVPREFRGLGGPAIDKCDADTVASLRKVLLGASLGEIRSMAAITSAQHLAKMGLCCFSSSPEVELMWALYSRGHRGVCLGFSTSGLVADVAALGGHFLRVTYSDSPSAPDFTGPIDRVAESLFGKKRIAWSYEQEARFITLDRNGPLSFTPSHLKTIVLGSRVSTEDEAAVKSMAALGPSEPTFFRARHEHSGIVLEAM